VADKLLLEYPTKILLEDGSGAILQEDGTLILNEASATLATDAYQLEDASGVILLEPVSVAYALSTLPGTFSIVGQNVTLAISPRGLTATFGAFAISGQSVTLKVAHLATVTHGLFALTGQNATLQQAKTLTAAHGLYSLTGQNATAQVARVVLAGFGAFAITGQDVTLAVTTGGVVAYAMTAQPGSFAITGQDATLFVTPAPPRPRPFTGGGYGGLMPKFWTDKLMPTLQKRYEEAKPEPIPEPEPALTPENIVAILSRLSFIVPKTEILLPEVKPLDEALVELRRIIENVKNMPPLTPVSVRSPEEIALELLKARIKQEDQQILELILTEVA
jgi:hypothetical protein